MFEEGPDIDWADLIDLSDVELIAAADEGLKKGNCD